MIAAGLVVALAATALIAYRWGAADRSEPAAAKPSASPSPSGPPSIAEIYQTLVPSVVAIRASTAATATSTAEIAGGTGVVVNADGMILTALHVVKGAQTIEVDFADGTHSAATIADADPDKDIATLTPATLPEIVVPAVLGGGVGVGDTVIAIGNQLSLTDSTTTGIVSGLDRTVNVNEVGNLKGLIQFDAAVNPGSSGGPLINAQGQTVGIIVALANPTSDNTFIGVGFAVPIASAVQGGRPPQL